MILKFRAWQREEDEEYSRMIRSEQSVLTAIRHVYGGAGIATGSGFSDINNQPEPGRYELMQYTGLKDKNGKDIYESDIVKCYTVTEEGEYEYVGVVCFKDFAFVIVDEKDTYDPLWNYKSGFVGIETEIEIIGNVYQNPELLEEL